MVGEIKIRNATSWKDLFEVSYNLFLGTTSSLTEKSGVNILPIWAINIAEINENFLQNRKDIRKIRIHAVFFISTNIFQSGLKLMLNS